MNDKKGEVKLSIGVDPNKPKENNSLTGPTKITVFNHRHERCICMKRVVMETKLVLSLKVCDSPSFITL
jgi:hypothetical protein